MSEEQTLPRDSWAFYSHGMLRSAKYEERKQLFAEMTQEVQDDQELMLRCEIAGTSHPFYIIIEDLVAFNWLMDKLNDPWDYLATIQPMVITLEHKLKP